jgi:hypothetical protein
MFNLDDYEDVAARVLRFQKAYPEGRIVTDVIQFNPEKGIVLVSAQVYRNSSDTLPAGVDYAFGDAATFNAGMRKWYVEDTSSSAIGRALSLVLETQKKPTKQDMAKVVKQAVEKPAPQDIKEGDVDYWTTPVGQHQKTTQAPVTLEKAMDTVAAILGTGEASEAPQCDHGHMKWREGDKAGKAWGGFFCTVQSQTGGTPKCPTKWFNLSPSGQWEPQKARV